MTGFAAATQDGDAGTLSVTVKSVNHRYLDMQIRCPHALAALESDVRARVSQRVGRGRIDVTIGWQPRQTAGVAVEINEPLVEELSAAMARLADLGLVSGTLTPTDVLRLPQAVTFRERLEEGTAAVELVRPLLAGCLEQALEELDRMRRQEGTYLRQDLDGRRATLAGLLERIVREAAAGAAQFEERVRARLRELPPDIVADQNLLAAEVVRLAARSDISEEVVRFEGHLAHWSVLTGASEPCGRKLDFLLQEMNREINTIGAKAEGLAAGELVVAAKAELEKMREQVQNVE